MQGRALPVSAARGAWRWGQRRDRLMIAWGWLEGTGRNCSPPQSLVVCGSRSMTCLLEHILEEGQVKMEISQAREEAHLSLPIHPCAAMHQQWFQMQRVHSPPCWPAWYTAVLINKGQLHPFHPRIRDEMDLTQRCENEFIWWSCQNIHLANAIWSGLYLFALLASLSG